MFSDACLHMEWFRSGAEATVVIENWLQPCTGLTGRRPVRAPAPPTPRGREACTPIVEKLYRWIGDERPKVIDEAPIAKAMNDLVNHREPLSRFFDDGRLRLDNNGCELQLRRQVAGRKNWLFSGSDDRTYWNATATSLVASCQLHGIEPWAHLRDVLSLLPTWPLSRAFELSPKAWNETRKQTETHQRLRALRLGRDDDGHSPERTA